MGIVERAGERRKRVMKAFIVVLVMLADFDDCDCDDDADVLSTDKYREMRGVMKAVLVHPLSLSFGFNTASSAATIALVHNRSIPYVLVVSRLI
jgi:hypothetical protein